MGVLVNIVASKIIKQKDKINDGINFKDRRVWHSSLFRKIKGEAREQKWRKKKKKKETVEKRHRK